MTIVETPIINALTVLSEDNVLAKAEHIFDEGYGSGKTGTAVPDASKYQTAINNEIWETPKAVEVLDVQSAAQGVGYVSYNQQVLSGQQQSQTRINIGAYPSVAIVNQTATTCTIQPATYNIWGEVAELNISLGSPEAASFLYEYTIQFDSGSTATTLTLPQGIRWIGDSTIESNATYIVSIANNIAVKGKIETA